MAKLMHVKYKSMTLVETIVAMVITVSALAAGFTVFAKAGAHYNSPLRTKAKLQMGRLTTETLWENNFEEDETIIDGLRFVKSIHAYENIEGLMELTITAYNTENKIIHTEKKLIRTER